MKPSTGPAPPIARRDFLNGVAVSALAGWSASIAPRDAFALSATGAGQRWGGNDTATYEVAHALRDGAFTDVDAGRSSAPDRRAKPRPKANVCACSPRVATSARAAASASGVCSPRQTRLSCANDSDAR